MNRGKLQFVLAIQDSQVLDSGDYLWLELKELRTTCVRTYSVQADRQAAGVLTYVRTDRLRELAWVKPLVWVRLSEFWQPSSVNMNNTACRENPGSYPQSKSKCGDE